MQINPIPSSKRELEAIPSHRAVRLRSEHIRFWPLWHIIVVAIFTFFFLNQMAHFPTCFLDKPNLTAAQQLQQCNAAQRILFIFFGMSPTMDPSVVGSLWLPHKVELPHPTQHATTQHLRRATTIRPRNPQDQKYWQTDRQTAVRTCQGSPLRTDKKKWMHADQSSIWKG